MVEIPGSILSISREGSRSNFFPILVDEDRLLLMFFHPCDLLLSERTSRLGIAIFLGGQAMQVQNKQHLPKTILLTPLRAGRSAEEVRGTFRSGMDPLRHTTRRSPRRKRLIPVCDYISSICKKPVTFSGREMNA